MEAYNKLTLEDLEKCIAELSKPAKQTGRRTILYTGTKGQRAFDNHISMLVANNKFSNCAPIYDGELLILDAAVYEDWSTLISTVDVIQEFINTMEK